MDARDNGFIAPFNRPSFPPKLTSPCKKTLSFFPRGSIFVFLSCSLTAYHPVPSTSTNCFSFKDVWIDVRLLSLSNCSQLLLFHAWKSDLCTCKSNFSKYAKWSNKRYYFYLQISSGISLKSSLLTNKLKMWDNYKTNYGVIKLWVHSTYSTMKVQQFSIFEKLIWAKKCRN